ncbi:caspase family protein [uncultured Roseibium sp.]|uniref:NADase-type glycan-binding domain-containing protein n=1 Tax=uncultured Roseibium sp. TaxID=1936171 RepID=UPI0026180C77|nr:caspase family protein [uncultured Roseibium sp.]
MNFLFRIVTGCWLTALLFSLPSTTHAAGKVALVIGNGAYQRMPALPNPSNDAELMASKLTGLGFDVVRIIDGDRRAFRDGLTRFGRRAQGADVALVFYAGHGVQVNGRNWLLPVDAEILASTDLPGQAVKADDLLEIMDASGARLKLVFLDACRNNPLPRSLSRGTTNGLARLEANAAGMMIAFATAPGDVALDGAGSNSPFTEALARLIGTPDLEVRHLMGRVRESVYTSTGERQLPWLNEALIGEFYFGGKSEGGKPSVAVYTPAPTSGNAGSEKGTESFTAARHNPLPDYAAKRCSPARSGGGALQVCASSVLDPQYGNRYGPGNLFDGKTSTAWVEGVSGEGAGEKVLVAFDRPRWLQGFEIVNGYAKNRDIFQKNARVRTANVTLSDGTTRILRLSDTMGAERYVFDTPVEAAWLEFEIGTVFPGSRYKDTAISEVIPLFDE